jgi:hypothetical protein
VAYYRPVEHIQCGEGCGRAVSDVVVGNGAAAAWIQREARLGAVERLNLALLVDGQHDLRGRIDLVH